MDKVSTDLQVAVTSIGFKDAESYLKEPDCLETLKDLSYFLRHDDSECTARKFIGSSNIVENDLVPLIILYSDDAALFDETLKLLVNLTQSADLFFSNDNTNISVNQAKQLMVKHLQISQHAFTDERFFKVLVSKMKSLIKKKWQDREEDETMIIQRILVLAKQVLSVPLATVDTICSYSSTCHDRIIKAIDRSGFGDILLDMSTSHANREFHATILEIAVAMLKYQKVEDVVKAVPDSNSLQQDEEERLKEKLKNSQYKLHGYSGRPSNFRGSYTVAGVKAIGGLNDIVVNKPVTSESSLSHDSKKKRKAVAKNRAPIETTLEPVKRSSPSVRIFLKSFCLRFIKKAFVSVMNNVYQFLHRAEGESGLKMELCYFWALRFFLHFYRYFYQNLGCAWRVISINLFHFVQERILSNIEKMKIDKPNARLFGRRAHHALKTYAQLLSVLWLMSQKVGDEAAVVASDIQRCLFRVVEYREVFINLLKLYNPTCLSKEYLRDLLEALHFHLKMLEFYCSLHGGSLVVQRKLKRTKKKKKNSKDSDDKESHNENENNEADQDAKKAELWSRLSLELDKILIMNSNLPADVVPFDAATDVSEIERQTTAKQRIQKALLAEDIEEALALLRASRELWPTEQEFGTAETEIEVLKSALYSAELVIPDDDQNDVAVVGVEDNDADSVEDEELCENDEEDEENGITEVIREVHFQITDFIQRLANPIFLHWYVWLLKDFRKNSNSVNSCIVSMLSRVAFDLNVAPLLYQASLFRIFQQVDELNKANINVERNRQLTTFAKRLLKQFFQDAEVNPNIYVEILFWKHFKESYEISYGYGSYDKKGASSKVIASAILESKIENLFHKFLEEPEKNTTDVADYIVENLDNTASRRTIVRVLRGLNLAFEDYLLKKKSSKSSTKRVWSVEEEEELKSLYEDFKNSKDVIDMICQNLSGAHSKRAVSKKLNELGLEVLKKYKRKKNEILDRSESESDENLEQHVSSDEESFNEEVSNSAKTFQDFNLLSPTMAGAIKCIKEDHTVVHWVRQCILEAINNQLKEDFIPLIPECQEHYRIIQKLEFSKTLIKLGFLSPKMTNQRYWCIPSSTSMDRLKLIAEQLNNSERIDIQIDWFASFARVHSTDSKEIEMHSECQLESENKSISRHELISNKKNFEKLRKLYAAKRQRNSVFNADDALDSTTSSDQLKSPIAKRPRGSGVEEILDIEQETEEMVINRQGDTTEVVANSAALKFKHSTFIESSEDSEDEMFTAKCEQAATSTQVEHSDSELDLTTELRKVPAISDDDDDDDDDDLPIFSVKKSSRVITTFSDED
ncbi:Protein timeless -like protein [Trichinella zimbabwensis]|uniref:Protein timeless-like protein n=1 Tax=Trichinella zimbabwensis TaxID=268475 RepID=A0A0V1I575_9BILA|nr:Protein timeless -like protein [Trichinella zimbabwensis]